MYSAWRSVSAAFWQCIAALFNGQPSLGHNWSDWWLLGMLLLSLGITGFAVEALRMHYTQVQPDWRTGRSSAG